MSSGSKKKSIIIISIILIILIITVTIVVGILITDNKENDNPVNPNTGGNNIFSNSYNEAISRRILTTSNYNGTYIFSQFGHVYFNKKSNENSNGLTQEEINKIIKEHCTSPDLNEFELYLSKNKHEEIDGEKIVLSKSMNDESETAVKYGYYRNYKNGDFQNDAKVYGDENLAVIIDDNDEPIYFLSLCYDNFTDARLNVVANKKTMNGKIYVFENKYDENGRLLYTVSYIYEIIDA